ncbi:MAG: cysteine desulfurase [Oscillospiraceae bacterium]|jgi:cysteine desulfurase/selenocysteine lyase|nr:cysteine desulfurase [Oscillospiraceae bacterium]
MQNSIFMDDFYKNTVKDFPLINKNQNVIYMDSAATTLKPQKVIDAVNDFYCSYTSNVFRGDHLFSERASMNFENTRRLVSSYINALPNEIIFTQNCTDSINLLKNLLNLTKSDVVISSILEHHSNYLPWLMNTNLLTVNIDNDGMINVDEILQKINKNTKLIAFTYVSNVTGNIQPIEDIIKICKENNILSLIDATQAVAHKPIDVKKIDCDFLAFSAHKMLGPSGVGVLYIKDEIIRSLKPFKLGGGMVDQVDRSEVIFKDPPHCFEAGTPAIENVIGFGAAIEYIMQKGIENVSLYLEGLNRYALAKLKNLDFIRFPFIIAEKHIPVFTFLPENGTIDIKYVSKLLSGRKNSIALNAGYQCCQPLYSNFKINGAVRASFYIYNSKKDIDELVNALYDIKKFVE